MLEVKEKKDQIVLSIEAVLDLHEVHNKHYDIVRGPDFVDLDWRQDFISGTFLKYLLDTVDAHFLGVSETPEGLRVSFLV